MAGGMDLGGSTKGGKKPLDAALNMVPFIDLMAVTIAFFIQAGTWTQVGAMQVSTAGSETSGAPQTPQVPINLLITEKALTLSVGGSPLPPMPLVREDNGRLEVKQLRVALAELKTQVPDQHNITLETEDSVAYDDLVRIIDQCRGSKFSNVAVMPAAN